MKNGMLVFLATLIAAAAQDVPTFIWSPTGRLAEARSSACVAALQDGRGLVAGGEGASGTLASVEIYGLDGQFAAGAAMKFARSGHTCTALNDGRVLVAGGGAAAEIYDPAANAWTVLDTPGRGRKGSTATLRPDGTVAIIGGSSDDAASAAIEIFDPVTNLISVSGTALSSARKNHASALLPDGSILIAGGSTDTDVLSTTEILSPDGSITAGPDLQGPSAYLSATTLPDGRVLIAGGTDGQSDLATAYLFSPSDSTLRPASALNTARSRHAGLAIPGNGSILIAGGDSLGSATASSEIFDLSTETFRPAGDLTIARRAIAAAALNQPGVVLSVGGVDDSGPLTACGKFIAPSIAFDKQAYNSGDAMVIKGAHWKPGSVNGAITLVNLRLTTTGFSNVAATADSLGNFQFTARISLTASTAGSNIQATVTGSDGNGATATSLQTDPTTTTLSLSASTPAAGQTVTITANVRDTLGLVSAIPGAVNFALDGAAIGSASAQGIDAAANHQFTFQTAGLAGGTHTLGATYSSGSLMFPSSSGSVQLPVSKIGATLSILATHDVTIGQTVQVTINMHPVTTVANIGPPTGVVVLQLNGSPVNLTLTPNNLAGVATATYSFTAAAVGTIQYGASYAGDANYNSLSGIFNDSVVSRGKVTVTLTPAKSSFSLGDDVALNVKLQPQFASSVAPTGTIQALQSIEQTSVAVAPGDSTGATTTMVKFGLLGVGSWTLSVHYSGDTRFDAADGQVTFQVSKATPSLIMRVQNVTTLNTTSYRAGIKVADPNLLLQSRFPGGTIRVFYNGSSTAAHTFSLTLSALSQVLDFGYATPDGIVAIPGTRFPIRFVYSGDSNYNSVEGTCNANVDLIADSSHISCDTYPSH